MSLLPRVRSDSSRHSRDDMKTSALTASAIGRRRGRFTWRHRRRVASLVAVIDCFTRLVSLVATKRATADEAARCLLDFVGRYIAVPRGISQTEGSSLSIDYQKDVFDWEWLQLYPLWAQGKSTVSVRANLEIVCKLYSFVRHQRMRESGGVRSNLSQRNYNSEPQSSLWISQNQLLFGNAVNLEHPILLLNTGDYQNQQFQIYLTTKPVSGRIGVYTDERDAQLSASCVECSRDRIPRRRLRHRRAASVGNGSPPKKWLHALGRVFLSVWSLLRTKKSWRWRAFFALRGDPYKPSGVIKPYYITNLYTSKNFTVLFFVRKIKLEK